MGEIKELEINLVPYKQYGQGMEYDLDRIIYDLDSQVELLSSQADTLDYLVSIANGVLCCMLDNTDYKIEKDTSLQIETKCLFVEVSPAVHLL